MNRFFNLDSPVMVGLTKMADMIILNLVAFFCCLPIITAGASLTALHYVSLKIVRDEECYILKSFFKSFKENFKQSTLIWLLMLLIGLLFVADFVIIRNSAGTSLPSWTGLALLGVMIIAALSFTLVFPLQAKFENNIRTTIKNSALMGVMILPKTILMLASWALPLICIFYFPQIMPITFCFGMSGPSMICALLYNKTFKKFEPEQETAASDEEWTVAVEEEEGMAGELPQTEQTIEQKTEQKVEQE